MKNLTSSEIRRMFLEFFESKGHLVMPSASLVPKDDPSILWTNAGVAPLKKYFDGREKPPKTRLTNAQKCIRTNDIENVGDTYHHTFFEMLGNFSIGDYFRDDALSYAWELLTSSKYYSIDKDRLYVTVYPDDADTYNKWVELGLDPSHIVKCEGNYWDIGPGPCGPDSEIFFDRGEEYDERGPELIEQEIDNDRYIEIWNNVFSQFNHVEGLERNEFPELPHKNIDTGMGLERIVCTLQNAKTNYDTDLFRPIIDKVEELSGVKYTDQKGIRSIADHIRTLTFALSDGARFSNEGRGYVLRRILRRASRFGRELGLYEPFMYKLTDKVIEIMDDAYPYLKENKDMVDELIRTEEETFLKTLDKGEKRLKELTEGNKTITGEDVFKLYDTYGFPYELTMEILNEKGIEIDKAEFDKCMEKQKSMAREAAKKTSGMALQGDIVNFKNESKFDYDNLKLVSKVIFVADENGNKNQIYSDGIIITEETPFYATMGGQVGDIGLIYNDNVRADVYKTEKTVNGQNAHYVRILNGEFKVGDVVTLEVDKENRFKTCQNHSATHLLQRALKDILGEEVNQAGSYVDGERLRFDFNYSKKIRDDEVIEVEAKVNDFIESKFPCEIKEMDLESAKKIGAQALFGEKYGDIVRVVKFGPSIELCGGTHVTNTGNIRRFAIKYIESKGANVYRVEAVCDTNLESEVFSMIKPYNDEMIKLLSKAKKIIEEADSKGISLDLNINISNDKPLCYKDIIDNKKEVEDLRKEVASIDKKYHEELTKKTLSNIDELINKKIKGKYGDVLILEFDNADMGALKQLIGQVTPKLDNGICFVINKKESSVNIIAKSNDSLCDKVDIGRLVKDLSIIAEGNGGGSKTYAQGGGTRSDNVDTLINYIKDNVVKEG